MTYFLDHPVFLCSAKGDNLYVSIYLQQMRSAPSAIFGSLLIIKYMRNCVLRNTFTHLPCTVHTDPRLTLTSLFTPATVAAFVIRMSSKPLQQKQHGTRKLLKMLPNIAHYQVITSDVITLHCYQSDYAKMKYTGWISQVQIPYCLRVAHLFNAICADMTNSNGHKLP